MNRSYLLLAAAVAILAVGLTALGRPRRAAPPAAAVPVAPVVELAIVIGPEGVSPAAAAVPKGHRVRLRVANHRGHEVRVALSGYEDRLDIGAIAAGAGWTGEFTADRPGEDFAWVIDRRPEARLVVTGSHLVEGHR